LQKYLIETPLLPFLQKINLVCHSERSEESPNNIKAILKYNFIELRYCEISFFLKKANA